MSQSAVEGVAYRGCSSFLSILPGSIQDRASPADAFSQTQGKRSGGQEEGDGAAGVMRR